MTFTNEERRLLSLYYSGSVADTVGTLFHALRDITDRNERDAVHSILSKIECAGGSALAGFTESGEADG